MDVQGIYSRQRHVPTDATVVEIDAGCCEFNNHVRARRTIAVDVLQPSISIALLRLYLELRPAWRIFGQQSFAIAVRRG